MRASACISARLVLSSFLKIRYGVYLMVVRLFETSLLVFFTKRTTKAMVATAVSVISLTIAQKFKPWLRDSDDAVSKT